MGCCSACPVLVNKRLHLVERISSFCRSDHRTRPSSNPLCLCRSDKLVRFPLNNPVFTIQQTPQRTPQQHNASHPQGDHNAKEMSLGPSEELRFYGNLLKNNLFGKKYDLYSIPGPPGYCLAGGSCDNTCMHKSPNCGSRQHLT